MSTRESVITFPPYSYFVILREAYLKITDNHCAAALLHVFQYWYENKLSERGQSEIHNKIARANGEPDTHSLELWVYKTRDNLAEDLFGLYSVKTIDTAIQLLIDREFIFVRSNPRYKWDRTKQYLFNPGVVQNAINSAYPSNLQNFTMDDPKRDNGLSEFAEAIPKNTTYNSNKDSFAVDESNGIHTPSSNGSKPSNALSLKSEKTSKKKFTQSKWYAVNEKTEQISNKCYGEDEANQKRDALHRKGWELIKGSTLEGIAKYHTYTLYFVPFEEETSILANAFIECLFATKNRYYITQLSSDQGRIGKCIKRLAECEGMTSEQARTSEALADDVRAFYARYKECYPNVDPPIHDQTFIENWIKWRSGMMKPKTFAGNTGFVDVQYQDVNEVLEE